ncbi:MAG: NAD-dependent epimerase/dehydratase family protein [Chitinophagaceae bacterium]
MKILLTGATGFLGTIIKDVLDGNEIITLSRSQSQINVDLSKEIPVLPNVKMVIHCAGKAHSVPKTQEEKEEFLKVNINGLNNLLTGLQNTHHPESFVYISSIAVYGRETGILINEDEPLLAEDPYGKSKIEAEQLITTWCKKNNIVCTILRLPLIAGTNPPGNLKAMISGIKNGYYFNIDGGKAKKSMVLAEDVAAIIPKVATIGGTYNLTDRYHPSFCELSKMIAQQTHQKNIRNLPLPIAKLIAQVGNLLGSRLPINSRKLKKIIFPLTFDDTKAQKALDWNPTPVLEGFKI